MTTIKLELPKLHPAQQQIKDEAKRFNVLECGRRWGKSTLGVDVAVGPALEGYPVGWFAPTVKILFPQWQELCRILEPAAKRIDKVQMQILLVTGGLIDFWSVDKPDSGRGRKYKRSIFDEASIARALDQIWLATIRPTLTDYRGDAWFFFTPKGQNYAHRLFMKGQEGGSVWMSWRKGTIENPFLSPEEIEDAKRDLPPHVFDQEYLGIPADDGGNPFGIDAIRRNILTDLAPGPAICYGTDLAKSEDYTVVCGLNADRQVCVLERFKIDWRQTKDRVEQIIEKDPALVDSTGVGDAILEDLQNRGLNCEGYIFSSRSKQLLMECLASSIQSDAIKIPEGWLQHELESFQYEYTRTGVRYEAPQGLHDDGVCALALANWHYEKMPVDPKFFPGESRREAYDISRRRGDVRQNHFARLFG